MASVESRAERLSARFPGLDVPAIQKGVHRNIKKLVLSLDGRYLDLLDLMNFTKNRGQSPVLSPENVHKHYSLSDNITLNGIYLHQYLSEQGYDPVVVQNYALANLPGLLEERPLAVCISTNFIFWDDVKDMAARIKDLDPQVPVIAGGMLVKRLLDPGENLGHKTSNSLARFFGNVDVFVVEAQGEQTLAKVLGALKQGGDLEGIPNLGLFDKAGNLRFTPRQAEDLPMDRTAIAWDRIPRPYLRKTLAVNTSRGCYYRCRFCTFHWLFPQVQYKSLDVLKQELGLINGLGFVEHVRFTDDNFTARKERLKQVLGMMVREKFDFTWSSYARASALTPELVKLMKDAGCEFVYMGIESGSQKILDNMDKKQTRDQAMAAIRMLNDHGIYCRGSFIVGYPGETRETFLETVDLINKSGLPYYTPYIYS
ncbi:MAG: radical SAM protein, partial [Deltaproteobacteria bacterium]|nr:radical SAM protein [Deltaproteobacteria bacterium]